MNFSHIAKKCNNVYLQNIDKNQYFFLYSWLVRIDFNLLRNRRFNRKIEKTTRIHMFL